MPNSLSALFVFVFFAFPPQQTTSPTATAATRVIPLEAASLVNPIKATPGSRTLAKNRYNIDCAMCHGANGNGKGDPGIISDMSLTMMDFTSPQTLKTRTDGEIFYIIKNGQGKMPSEDRVKTDGIWNLVVYVRSLSKK